MRSSAWCRWAVVPVVGGLLASAFLVRARTYAAWTSSSANSGNTFTAGTVTFGANSPATAMFTATNAFPGSTGTACVKLTYTGNLAATVKMYAALTTSALAPYLNWRVTEGSGSASDCSDFVAGTQLYGSTSLNTKSTTLSTFAVACSNYGNGVGTWAPTPGTASSLMETYKIEWRLQDDNTAESLTAAATLTWEARNS